MFGIGHVGFFKKRIFLFLGSFVFGLKTNKNKKRIKRRGVNFACEIDLLSVRNDLKYAFIGRIF